MKEELDSIKECRNVYAIIGVVVVIYGLVLVTFLAYDGDFVVVVSILVFFTGIIFLVMTSDYARKYRDKLKELKKVNK